MITNSFVIAVRMLTRNWMRTLLTSLGIFIGVAAVIIMVSVGQGATAAVNQDLAGLGQNLLFLMPGTDRSGPAGRAGAPPFDVADARAIAESVDGLAAVAPTSALPQITAWGEQQHTANINGGDAAYVEAMQWEIATGRRFSEAEEKSGAAVCILGLTVKEELFGAADPLGASIRVGRLSCEVIGVFAPKGQNTFGLDQDDFVLVPLRTFQRRLAGNQNVNAIFMSAEEGADTDAIAAAVDALMRQRRHIRPGTEPDFTVRDMKEIAEMLGSISGVLTSLLGAIAAVSLLVGGIGIMNIMMVSVTERTREIGIRLAVGALARDVLLQFLVEAMVLASVGGMAGIAFGVIVSKLISDWLEIPWVVDPLLVGGAFAFSGLIGVIFGFFPARRAANMKPIDALRHE